MKITLELPPYLEKDFSQEAEKLGLPLTEYVLRLISSGGFFGVPPKTGAELVEYWEKAGVIGSRLGIKNSAKHARDLRKKSQKRGKD